MTSEKRIARMVGLNFTLMVMMRSDHFAFLLGPNP